MALEQVVSDRQLPLPPPDYLAPSATEASGTAIAGASGFILRRALVRVHKVQAATRSMVRDVMMHCHNTAAAQVETRDMVKQVQTELHSQRALLVQVVDLLQITQNINILSSIELGDLKRGSAHLSVAGKSGGGT